jgi:putative ABC transport system substrate-binding protein
MLRGNAIWFIILALATLVAPLPAVGQPASRLPTVGVLVPTTTPPAARGREAFEHGLKELGWIPGQTIRIEYRYADGKPERLEELARDLVRGGVDVLVARGSPAIGAAKKATTTIPIVMSAAGLDPVQQGFVAKLARPGGNVTGLTLLNQDLYVKHLELLKEVVPRLLRVAVLGSLGAPLPPKGRQDLESAAAALGLELRYSDVRGAGDLDQAFEDIARGRAGALLVRADPFVLEANDRRVVDLALKYRLPAVYWLLTFPRVGGLMSYGADLFAVHGRSAFYVDRLLRGTRPAELPVEEPTKFEFVLNLKTARALGLTIPPAVMARANEVIQ